MTVRQLNRDQLICLKQAVLFERYGDTGESPSYGELARADDIIRDEDVFRWYDGYVFSPYDFGTPA